MRQRKHNIKFIRQKFIFLLLSGLILACNKSESSFDLVSFEALTNFEFSNDTLVLEMDLSGGPFEAVSLPSQNGPHHDKTFHFEFTVKNNRGKPAPVYYKIYYQNESYKHKEARTSALTQLEDYNPDASENFYGSWISDTLIGFRQSKIIPARSEITITDSFFISGNPLNDSLYFGPEPENPNIKSENIEHQIQVIKDSPEWYEAVVEKAKNRNRALEEQLLDDAAWVLQNQVSEISTNQRWQRNPRVGAYSFMLVVGSKDEIEQLPASILNMSQLDEKFKIKLNPFYYFNYESSPGVRVAYAPQVLKTFAVLRPEAGLFYNGLGFKIPSQRPEEECNNDEIAFKYAHFMQFVNEEVLDSSLHNIDIKANVKGNSYTQALFEKNAQSARRNTPSYVLKPNEACENAWYDPAENVLVIQNTGNTTRPYKKENAGVEGRIGFSYGKYTARIRFPEILNNHNVWNGVTCAFWLKFQSLEDWNIRNACQKEGYVVHNQKGEDYSFKPQNAYSEIDIEIIKTSKHWPPTSYKLFNKPEYYDSAQDHNLIVSCTNWDLACKDPSKFGVGAKRFSHDETNYEIHRWDRWYRALTLKTERPAEKTVGDVLLYQIDWQPHEITWRLGSDKTEMDEVGYMDETVTKIPNNQMVPVMSQEFHYGHWWPMTPFPQGDIPYPDEAIRGYLYEVVIE